MEKHQKFSVWYVLLGVWVVLSAQNLLVSFFAIETIPYSKFLKLLNEDRITEIAITANRIQGKMRGEGADSDKKIDFRTVRVDADLSERLEQHNVVFKGEIESTFLRDLLSWIVPVLFFAGIWYLIIKRMTGQQPGFMTLGKNKARI